MVKKRTKEIMAILDEIYGLEVVTSLDYRTPWELLVATMLSAQCTDERVNQVTPALFEAFPTVEAMAEASIKDIERLIHSTGFYRNKAKNLLLCANQVLERHKGKVPETLEELTELAGVGRKTANVIRGNIFHQPSIVVDTHVKRISHRLGVTESLDPVKAEQELMKALPKDHWIAWNMQLITFGREICKSQGPKCEQCQLTKYCRYYKEKNKKTKYAKKSKSVSM